MLIIVIFPNNYLQYIPVTQNINFTIEIRWFPYDRGSQIAIRSAIEPCSISCDCVIIRKPKFCDPRSKRIPRFNARVFDCRNGLRYGCVYYRSRKDFNDKNKKARYWEKIGQKIHLSAEEAEAKFLQHKNCIRSELATPRLIMTNRRSKFACSKISALPRSRCCLFSAGGRGQLVGSAVRMIRAIMTSLPVKREILSSFENGAGDFIASNDFFFQPGSGWGLFSC